MRVPRSVLLDTGARTMVPTLLVVSIYLLAVGHDLPGGGFVGGLMAGAALLVVFLTGGRPAVDALLPAAPQKLVGAGIAFAVTTAAAGVLLGNELLEAAKLEIDLGWFGMVAASSTLVFDIGVYLVVVGLVATIVRRLGDPEGEHP